MKGDEIYTLLKSEMTKKHDIVIVINRYIFCV